MANSIVFMFYMISILNLCNKQFASHSHKYNKNNISLSPIVLNLNFEKKWYSFW